MVPVIRTILYASDLGDSASRVFAYAIALARQHDARIVFLHALEPLGPTAQTLVRNMLPQEQLQRLQAGALAKVREEIAGRIDRFCRSELGVETAESRRVAEIRIVDGHPAEVIAEQAGALQADLVVLGTHGRGGLQRALLGSVARKVVSRADRPVLLVPIPDDVK